MYLEQVNSEVSCPEISLFGGSVVVRGGASSLGGLRVISGPDRAAISGGKAGSRRAVIPLEFKISLII